MPVKSDGFALPAHLRAIHEAEYPRFSDAEMARRRAAIERFAPRNRPRSPDLLRCQSVRLVGAVAHRLAGHRRGGRRLHAGRARRIVRAARQSRAAGAAAGRAGRSRLGRRLVDRRGHCRTGKARGARRPGRRHRADDFRAARDAGGAVRRDRQSQPDLYAPAADQIGRGDRLDADRRRARPIAAWPRCATACGPA